MTNYNTPGIIIDKKKQISTCKMLKTIYMYIIIINTFCSRFTTSGFNTA